MHEICIRFHRKIQGEQETQKQLARQAAEAHQASREAEIRIQLKSAEEANDTMREELSNVRREL